MTSDRDVMSGHRDCGGDAAAYALGALEPSEAAAFRRHLATCAVCQDEVSAFEQAADNLAVATLQLPAPPRLRRRVTRAVRAQARSERRRARARPRVVPRLALAGAVVLVVLATAFVALFPAGAGPRVIQASVLGSPGTAQLRVASGSVELVVRRLPRPPSGEIYEVWLQRPGRAPTPTSALFSVTAAGAADVGVPGNLHGVGRVMVTVEPDGGSRVPTHPPLIVAKLSRA